MTTENNDNTHSSGNWKVWLVVILLVSLAVNAYLLFRHQPAQTASTTVQKELYTCPMHPQVIQDHPGDCPICGMKLVKKTGNDNNSSVDTLAGMVSISPARELLANIRTEKPEMRTFASTVSIPGKVAIKQDAQWKTSLRVMARVDSIYVNEPGTPVHVGDRLVTVYSPDLIAAEQEYILALSDSSHSGYQIAAESKLRALGIDDNAIAEIKTSRKPHEHFTLHATHRGVLMERMAKVGEWAMSGMTLLDFVDLSSVWVEAAFFEKDAHSVKTGDHLAVHFGTVTQTAIVKSIGSELDMMTRTLPVRAELSNPDNRWKPGMSVEVEWQSGSQKEYLSVPEEAILQTGTTTRVWMKSKQGSFMPMAVTIGPRSEGRVAILSGITVDDEVAVTGGYLIDAESQMKNIGSAMPGMKMTGDKNASKTGTQSNATEPVSSKQTIKKEQSKKVQYICPMDAEVVSDKPGKCPICGMNLEKKEP